MLFTKKSKYILILLGLLNMVLIICACTIVAPATQQATLYIEDRINESMNHQVPCDVVFISKTLYRGETARVPLLFVLKELGLDVRMISETNATIFVDDKSYQVSIPNATITLDGYDPDINFLHFMTGSRTGYIQPQGNDVWVDVDSVRATVEDITGRRLIRKISIPQKEVTFIWVS